MSVRLPAQDAGDAVRPRAMHTLPAPGLIYCTLFCDQTYHLSLTFVFLVCLSLKLRKIFFPHAEIRKILSTLNTVNF